MTELTSTGSHDLFIRITALLETWTNAISSGFAWASPRRNFLTMGTPTNDAANTAASRAPSCVAAVARQRAADAPLTLVQLVESIETLLWDAPSATLEEKHSILERALTYVCTAIQR
jgi:hypothetical protein